jgi:two-component system sensor histidine kinase/response regulator
LEFVINIHPEVPRHIKSDPVRIQQVLVNLIGNAIKFTEKGHVLLDINVIEQSDTNNQLSIRVVDTGIGMTPENMNRLFESFMQADNSITRKFGGTGLGLAISKQIVELMGGKIWVESEVGQGSKFCFDIDFEEVDEEAAPPMNKSDLNGLKILAVDDNDVSLMVLEELLHSIGCRVVTAKSGQEAIQQLNESVENNASFDMVITDWFMPEMDGIELARIIQEHQNHFDTIAVLMVTAYDKDDAMSLGIPVGVSGFLEKPINSSLLLEAIMIASGGGDGLVTTAVQDQTLIDLSAVTILLVEDNALNQQVALGFLSETNAKVDVADNGLIALEKISQRHYDMVLMDIQMPVMDGMTATQAIRKQTKFDDMPIIAMTAHSMSEELSQFEHLGMNGHVSKPIDPTLLFSILARWFGGRDKTNLPRQSKAEVVQVSPQANDETFDHLTRFSTLNVAKALEQFFGKKAMLLEFIHGFHRDAPALREQLVSLHQNKQSDVLFLKVHTLKTNLAYIGAYGPSQICGTLEGMIRQKEDITAPLTTLLSQLEALNAELDTLPEQVQIAVEAQPIDVDELGQILTNLIHLLDEADSSAEDLMPDLQTKTLGSPYAAAISQINELIKDVEYDEAVECAQQLLTTLPNSLEQV